MPKTLLVALLVSCAFSVFSQEEFKDGFIIQSGNKFSYGYISITGTPNITCLFKKSKEDAGVTYSPDQIEGYGIINGTQFRSKSIKPVGEASEKKVFLEALTDGIIVLYRAPGRIFIERGESFYELKDEKGKEAGYRSIVVSFVAGAPQVAKKAKKVQIEIGALRSLIDQYHVVTSGGTVSRKRETGVQKSAAFFSGIDRTQYSLSGSTEKFLNSKQFIDRTLVHGGLNFTIKPSALRYVSFVSGIWYSEQKFYLNAVEKNNTSAESYFIRANFQSIKLPALLQVDNFIDTRVKPYVKLGVILPINLKSSMTLHYELDNQQTAYQDRYEINDLKEPLQVLGMVGASFSLRSRISLFSEAWFSSGQNDFRLKGTAGGKVTGNFKGMGINFGLLIQLHDH
jgi:hypothetical protein